MPLNPGDTLLNGQYHILRLLGRGGFGFVYQAQDTQLREQVAIKELIPGLIGDEVMLKRFLAEARATMRLTNKHIVRTYHVFPDGANYYIVMEYMPGGSLEERLRQHGPLSIEEAVLMAAQVCAGLTCAHEEAVIHCDLKPANILFDAAGRAKVADFGVAHVSGEMLTRSWATTGGFVAGTLPYMSPEQTDGVRDDPRIDVYALGAVLYRALTGRNYLPFDVQETPRAQAVNVGQIYAGQPVAPSRHNPAIPVWLDGVVLKALAKQPTERYPSAEAMRGALLEQQLSPARAKPHSPPPTQITQAMRGAGPSPTPQWQVPSPPPPIVVPAPRKSSGLPGWFWPAAAAAAALLVVLVIAVIMLLGGRRDDPVAMAGTTTAGAAQRETANAPATLHPQATSTLALSPTSEPQPPIAGATQVRITDGMMMAYVPAGAFLMGSTEAEAAAVLTGCSDCKPQWFTHEQPQHTVTLDAFWIDATEVTNAQFRECVAAGACEAPTTCDRGEATYEDASKAQHPVVCVAWSQAMAYCQWAGARLPTEAEWEGAARGTHGLKYPWGDSAPDCSKAQYSACGGKTVPAGSKAAGASPYGLLDMAGNAWEWVADWHHPEYYVNSPADNPTGPSQGDERVVRGGSWGNDWYVMRAAYRYSNNPTDRFGNVGFRCVVSAPAE